MEHTRLPGYGSLTSKMLAWTYVLDDVICLLPEQTRESTSLIIGIDGFVCAISCKYQLACLSQQLPELCKLIRA